MVRENRALVMAKHEVPVRYTGNEVRRGVTLLHSITE